MPTSITTKAISSHQTLAVGGRERTFTVVGSPESPRARDLVLIFHGSKQTGDVHRKFTGGSFDALTRDNAAVVVYLDGFKGNWNDARKESFFPARLEGMDDVAFTRAVINQMSDSHGINRGRVFAVGYSNGGQMVIRLIHEVGELLAGAAVISATMPNPDGFLAPPSSVQTIPMPVLLIHGTKDPIVPFEGGTMKGWAKRMFKVSGTARSMPETAAYFASRNGIVSEPVKSPKVPGQARTWIEQTDYRQDGHPPVRLLTVHGGGHTVPNAKKAPFILGRTHQETSAAAAAEAFFGITVANSRSQLR